MQFLMNKTSIEQIDLFTNYKCIAFCITFYYNHVLGIWRGWKDFGSVMFDFAQGHLCFHVLMFLLSIKRHLAGVWICRYDFFYLKADGSTGLTGSNVPIHRCILHSFCRKRLFNHASYCVRHNGKWWQTTWWPSSTFYYYLWLLLKRWRKTKPAVVNATSAHWIYRLSIWSESALRWHSVWNHRTDWTCFLNTVDHACTLLEFVKVLSRGKWSKNCTASLWKLWLWQDSVLVIPGWKNPDTDLTEKTSYLKENSPSGPPTLLTSTTLSLF